jgi:hypothetical protein
MFWETGAGVNVSFTPATYQLPLYAWTYITWRKRDVSGGTCTLDLFINGALIATQTGVTNATNGTSAIWRFGHEFSGGLPTNMSTLDIAGAYVWAEALTEDSIRQDTRRFLLQDFATHIDMRAYVNDVNGNPVDLTDVGGVDFVDSVDVTDEIDQPCVTARVSLAREVENLSLASLKTDTKANLTDPNVVTSYAPLIEAGRVIEVTAARVPLGIQAVDQDLQSVFRGTIDTVNDGSDGVSLDCRDLGGILIDTFIEETVTYGDEPPVAVEGEMQWILNDNDNNAGNNSVGGLVARTGSYAPITLYTPVSPSWVVRRWKQRRENVLGSLRTLAGQIGWECRYRWDQNPAQKQWRLTFFEPDRAKLSADAVVAPNDLLAIEQLSRNILGVRNVVRVLYPSSETSLPAIPPLPVGYTARQGFNNVDGEGARNTAFIEVQSDTSIAAYGRRLFMEVAEGSSSQIDTIGEAFDMSYGSLRDLEEAQLDKSVRLPLMPELELNDAVLFLPNERLFTVAQRLAVRSITHSYSEQATTTVQLRGKPSVGFKRWLRLEARGDRVPGVISPVDALGDLTQGTLLTVMRNVLDRTAYLSGGKFVNLRNGNFQAFSNGLQWPPDAWSMRAGTWKTDIDVETTSMLSGNKAIRFLTVTGQLASDIVPTQGDFNTPYSFQMLWARTSVSSYYPRVDVEFYASDKTTLLSTYTLEPLGTNLPGFGTVTTAANTWFLSRADGIRPPTGDLARYMRVVIRGSLTGAFVQFLVDDAGLYRTARELSTFTINPYTLPGATLGWYPVRTTSPGYPSTYALGRFDYGNNHFSSGANPSNPTTVTLTGESIGTSRGDGFYCREDGVYQVNAIVCVNSSSNATQYSCARLVRNATYNANYTNATGVVLYQSGVDELLPVANFGNANVIGQRAMIQVISTRVALQRGDTLSLEWNRTLSNQNALGSAAGNLLRFNVKQEFAQ